MKKIFAVLFMGVLLSVGMATSSIASASPAVFLDGRQLSFDVPPMTENGRTLVPARAIFEALGASVMWDETTRTVTAVKADIEIKIIVAQKTAYKNGVAIVLSTPPQVIDGRILVPLRFVSESLGADVIWHEENQAIDLRSAPQASSIATPPATQPMMPPVTPPSNTGKFLQMIRNFRTIISMVFLVMAGILLSGLFLRRSGDGQADKQIETPVTPDAKYQEGLHLIQQQNWADAKLALISLAMDKYKEAEPLCNYAEAQEQYKESNMTDAADPYWAAYMADYYCRKIPDIYAGSSKDEILKFKVECKNRLDALEKDPVAQNKHMTAQEQQKKQV